MKKNFHHCNLTKDLEQLSLLSRLFLFLILFFLNFFQHNCATASTERKSYWVELYNALSINDHPMVDKTFDVFERVRAAADKRENRYPGLVILKDYPGLLALSLMDGTVLISREVMEFCFKGGEKETGKARMALILGHEIAHLARDDFWHFESFQAMETHGVNKKYDHEIKTILMNTTDLSHSAKSMEIRQQKEFQADGYGMLYAAMAGYDIVSLIEQTSLDHQTSPKDRHCVQQLPGFFREWKDKAASFSLSGIKQDGSHPKPEHRTAFIKAKMLDIAEDIVLFHWGTRLCQLGRYADALEFLMDFKKKFPSREVLNTIGLANYHLAMEHLNHWNPEKLYRFRLSTVLDTYSRATPFDRLTLRSADCNQDRIYKAYLDEAVRYFSAACDRDPYYFPSRINLSSAFIMAGQFSSAVSELDPILKKDPDNVKALNNRALALYLMGPSIHVDMFETSMKSLKQLTREHPENAAVHYNFAALLNKRKRSAAAKEAWQTFLNIETKGKFAAMAENKLNIKGHRDWDRDQDRISDNGNQKLKTEIASETSGNAQIKNCDIVKEICHSPVKLGDMDDETIKQLKGCRRRIIDIGSIYGEYYFRGGLKVLVIEGVVEVVECLVDEKQELSEYLRSMKRAIPADSSDGLRTTDIYNTFAVDRIGGRVEKIIYFQ